MESPDGSYAPQSPDLSGYQAYPPNHSSSYYNNQQTSNPSNYTPMSSSFNNQLPPHSHGYLESSTPRGKMKAEQDEGDWMPDASTQKSGRRSKKPKIEEDFGGKIAPGVAEGIEVKTKFPVARIKRIMQADEDVGKVAQVTPTAVSKALELFMISLVTKSADLARQKSSKKVTAAHLKQVIEKDEQFDFLAEIIAKVPNAPAPKKEEDSEDAAEGKKKRGAPRKKRKTDEDL